MSQILIQKNYLLRIKRLAEGHLLVQHQITEFHSMYETHCILKSDFQILHSHIEFPFLPSPERLRN